MPLADHALVRAPTITVLARPRFTEPAQLPVQWVGDATEGERLAEYASRLAPMSQHNPAQRPTREHLEHLARSGRSEALAHVSYTLLLDGVSRSLSHQLARLHPALASAEQSPHYAEEQDVRFVVPPAILGDAALEAEWCAQIEQALASYHALIGALLSRYGWINDKVHRRRVARDAADSVLPGALATRLVVTGSARDWRTLIALRGTEQTDLELRRLAVALLPVLHAEAPALFGDFVGYRDADRRDSVRVPSP